MKKVLFLFLVIFIIPGCELPQNTAMQNTEKKKEVLVDESVTKDEEVLIAKEGDKKEAVTEEIKVKALVLAKQEDVPIIESVEEIIKQNRWGFSIYDPKTGIIEYYTSNGGYLGKKSNQE
ncbi:MAG: hypothetical protein ABIA97_00205 [Candidatus Omnitrophota bacterium]